MPSRVTNGAATLAAQGASLVLRMQKQKVDPEQLAWSKQLQLMDGSAESDSQGSARSSEGAEEGRRWSRIQAVSRWQRMRRLPCLEDHEVGADPIWSTSH